MLLSDDEHQFPYSDRPAVYAITPLEIVDLELTVAVDAMGGDFGPEVTVPAALTVLRAERDARLCLIGKSEEIESVLESQSAPGKDRLSIIHASEVVTMDDSPAQALRRKKDSSMRVALNMLKSGDAHACVSAGNTGALMATARFVLKTLPGIDRPAIVKTLPTMNGHVHVLDLGANIDSPPRLLMQFGVMASILVELAENISRPKVGLLNIGVEDSKGNDTIREAAELLRESGLNYQGYVEGNAIYTGDLDVVVCDGFVGNVALKTSEGLAQMMTQFMRQEFQRNVLTRIAAILALPVINALKRRVDHRRYNGATLLGLNGVVIKSHGSADDLAFAHAIQEGLTEARKGVPEHIKSELQSLSSRQESAV